MPPLRLWFNQSYRGTYQLIGLLRAGAAPRRLVVHGTHAALSTPFLQACDVAGPEPQESGDAFVAVALDYCRRHAVDVFVPGRERLAVARRREEFAAAGVAVLVSPAAALEALDDKRTTVASARDLGVPVPLTHVVDDLAGFSRACDAVAARGRQVCFKPAVDHGGRGFRILDDAADGPETLLAPPTVALSRARAEALLARADPFPVLVVNEYLPGPELSVDCLSRDGELLAAVPRGKGGPEWTRELLDDPDAVAIAARMVAGHRLSYLSNVQVRYDADGRPVLLEVNTRASSGLYQSCASGLNLPWLAVRVALGENPDVASPRLGRTLVTYTDAMPWRPPPFGTPGGGPDSQPTASSASITSSAMSKLA